MDKINLAKKFDKIQFENSRNSEPASLPLLSVITSVSVGVLCGNMVVIKKLYVVILILVRFSQTYWALFMNIF